MILNDSDRQYNICTMCSCETWLQLGNSDTMSGHWPRNEVDAPCASAVGGAVLMMVMLLLYTWFQVEKDVDCMLLGCVMAFALMYLRHPKHPASNMPAAAYEVEAAAEARPLLQEADSATNGTAIQISGCFWASLSSSAVVAYTAAVAFALFNIQECIWQVLLVSTLCGSFHLFLYYKDWTVLAALPVITNVGFLPFVTLDRIPFAFVPAGCPPDAYYLMVAFSLISAIALCRCQGVSIRIVHQPSRSWTPEKLRNRFHFSFESVPVACATLSVVYLACCLKWSGSSGTGQHDALQPGCLKL